MTVTPAVERRQLVTCEVAGERFAVDIFAVERVLRFTPPRLLPNSASWLRGVIDLGDSVIPVVDLRERLGLPLGAIPESARILVVAVDDARIGVTVDAVHAIRTVLASAIEPPPAIYRGLAKDYLEGIVRQDGEIFVVLAAARLLTSTERIEMGRIMSKEARDG